MSARAIADDALNLFLELLDMYGVELSACQEPIELARQNVLKSMDAAERDESFPLFSEML